MNCTKFITGALCAIALCGATVATGAPVITDAYGAKPVAFNNTILETLLNPLHLLIQQQKTIITDADKVSQRYKMFAQERNLANEDQGHQAALVGCIDQLQKKLNEFEILVAAPYVSLSDFSKSTCPAGAKFFMVGTVARNSLGLGRATIENQQNYMVDLILPQYAPDQQSLDYAFIVYGTKVNTANGDCLQSEQLLYLPVLMDDFNATARTYHGSLPDIAAHYYYGHIIPGLKYKEQFSKIADEIAAHKQVLEGIIAGYLEGIDRNRDRDHVQLPAVAPAAAFPMKYILAGLAALLLLVLIAVILAVALRPARCRSCGAKLVNGACQNPDCPSKPRCPSCGSPLRNGVCPNAGCPSKVRHCKDCGAVLGSDGVCPNPNCPGKKAKKEQDSGETYVPRPGRLVNFDPDATNVPSHLYLKVKSPANWSGYVFKGLPRRFEIGRDSDKTPEGTPFLLLDLKDNPRANECSRRYVRLTESEGGDGFNVDLLTGSGNPCVIDGKALTGKGESALAKVGSVIGLNPDWEFEVVNGAN